ncbi:MAG: hypothetical protein MMC33_008362 [Icmadophila ericetorum]|nr:hypothetical protein [Icmadophila ericetorum]
MGERQPRRFGSDRRLSELIPDDHSLWTGERLGDEDPLLLGQVEEFTPWDHIRQNPHHSSSSISTNNSPIWTRVDDEIITYFAKYVIKTEPGNQHSQYRAISDIACYYFPDEPEKFEVERIHRHAAVAIENPDMGYHWPPENISSMLNCSTKFLTQIFDETMDHPDLLNQPDNEHAWLRKHLTQHSPLFWPWHMKNGFIQQWAQMEPWRAGAFPIFQILDWLQQERNRYASEGNFERIKTIFSEEAAWNFALMLLWEHVGFQDQREASEFFSGKVQKIPAPPSVGNPFWTLTETRKRMRDLSVFHSERCSLTEA